MIRSRITVDRRGEELRVPCSLASQWGLAHRETSSSLAKLSLMQVLLPPARWESRVSLGMCLSSSPCCGACFANSRCELQRLFRNSLDDFHCGLDSRGDCRWCLVYGNPVPAFVALLTELLASRALEKGHAACNMPGTLQSSLLDGRRWNAEGRHSKTFQSPAPALIFFDP